MVVAFQLVGLAEMRKTLEEQQSLLVCSLLSDNPPGKGRALEIERVLKALMVRFRA